MNHSSIPLTIATLPAKTNPFQSILTHSTTTGVIAQELYTTYLARRTRDRLASALRMPDERLASFVGYLASLHDIGKLAPICMMRLAQKTDSTLVAALTMNEMIPDGDVFDRPAHEETTARIVQDMWKKRHVERRVARFFAGVLGAHHQPRPYDAPCDCLGEEKWKALRDNLERAMSQTFNWTPECGLPAIARDDEGFVGMILIGLTILADWIGSGEYFADAEYAIAQNGTEWIQQRTRRFLAVSDLVSAEPPIWERTFDDMWPEHAGQARPLQREVESMLQSESLPALLLIEAPMGEGKTEAALLAACNMDSNGFYVALPTSATANQMASRVTDLLGRHLPPNDSLRRVRLLHSTAWLSDSTDGLIRSPADEDSAAERWLEPQRRGLLAPYAVGTVDQAMLSAMSVRYGVLRLLGLAGKTLVIDEIHAYDAYMSGILSRLLAWCRAMRTPVVLLSATLTSEKRRELLKVYTDKCTQADVGSYPAITTVSWEGDVAVKHVAPGRNERPVNVTVLPILHKAEAIASQATELVADGGCACVLVNTVHEARQIYKAILHKVDATCRLLLFHSRFPASRRAEVEKECLQAFGGGPEAKRPKKAILVATQVVEQSLDIDVDVLMTSVAPIDLVLQRLGRMHRHDIPVQDRPSRLQEPHLYLMRPTDGQWGDDGLVYPECLLQRTTEILMERSRIQVPTDIPTLVEEGYNPDMIRPEQRVAWSADHIGAEFAHTKGLYYCIKDPARGFEPLKSGPRFDEQENAGSLSAHTRLGEPSVRIALLEPNLFAEVKAKVEENNRTQTFSHALVHRVMDRSVSIPEKKLSDYNGGLRGFGLLASVRMFPSCNDVYAESDGRTITYDDRLGVLID